MTKLRFLTAALISPWAAPVIMVAVGAIMVGDWSAISWSALSIAGTFAVITSYVGLFAIGLPIIYVLRRVGYLNFLTLAATGTLAGIVVLYLFKALLSHSFSFEPRSLLSGAVSGAVLGLAEACLFGLIAGIPLRRPIRI